jgi:hypothetical protein
MCVSQHPPQHPQHHQQGVLPGDRPAGRRDKLVSTLDAASMNSGWVTGGGRRPQMGWTYLPCNSTGQRTGAAKQKNCIYGKPAAAVFLRLAVNCNGTFRSRARRPLVWVALTSSSGLCKRQLGHSEGKAFPSSRQVARKAQGKSHLS